MKLSILEEGNGLGVAYLRGLRAVYQDELNELPDGHRRRNELTRNVKLLTELIDNWKEEEHAQETE